MAETELAFVAKTASSAGLDLWLDIQIDDTTGSLSEPNQTTLSQFLDQYTELIVQTGQLAQQYGVKSIMLNPGAVCIDLGGQAPQQRQDLYATKMLVALTQLRNVFRGTIRLFDICFPGSLDANFAALFSAADIVQVELVDPRNFVTPEENANLSLPLVKAKMKDFLAQWTERLAPFSSSKPLALYALVQSQRDTLASGWVEDCCCVTANGAPAVPPNCYQNTLQTDFSVQAIAYEALFEAAMESGLNFTSFDTKGYWYTDVVLPKESFPNTSQSVRNKPAEAIVERWFQKQ